MKNKLLVILPIITLMFVCVFYMIQYYEFKKRAQDYLEQAEMAELYKRALIVHSGLTTVDGQVQIQVDMLDGSVVCAVLPDSGSVFKQTAVITPAETKIPDIRIYGNTISSTDTLTDSLVFAYIAVDRHVQEIDALKSRLAITLGALVVFIALSVAGWLKVAKMRRYFR